ncbi:endonuclease/exonuclease/phosphatase family protein [Mycolicibacterium pulveris]|uniref:endonuclease/exonuclease/phosphatase family protein n=1 Tax=Mycolicibacterium pulveris TaxID=36813 RepID=UPI003CFB4E5D
MTILGIAALAVSAVALIVRAWPVSNIMELVAAVASPYVPLVALLGLMLLAYCRQIFLSIIALAVVTASLAMIMPWYYFGTPADVGRRAEIQLLSSNLRKGRTDAPSFVRLANESAEVVTVSELTPEEVQRFAQAGIEEAFPYSVLKPATGAGGIGLWSRFPLASVRPAKQRDAAIVAARVQVPEVRLDPLIASVHITSPVTAEAGSFDRWRSGITNAKANLDHFAEIAGPAAVIVAGDFNSTPDMRQFRDLLTDGYRDAVEQTGAGFAPTFPSNKWFPPLLVIDHVLTRNAAASSIRTVNIPGSDHRALLATIKVPLDPTAS